MAFRVEISEDAENDARGILEWLISQYAGETGLRWFEGLKDAMVSLSEFPQRCPLAPENGVFPFEVRHLFYGRKAACIPGVVHNRRRNRVYPARPPWAPSAP